MNKLTQFDIIKMLKIALSENLNITTPDEKDILISKGYKIRHIKSGLLYTVTNVNKKSNKFYITAKSGDGNAIVIAQNEFNKYGSA
jgi:hypothetical protein